MKIKIRRPDVAKLFGRAPLAIVRSSGATHHSDCVLWVRTICDAGSLLQAAKLHWTTLLSVRLSRRLCGSQNDTTKTSGLFARCTPHRTSRVAVPRRFQPYAIFIGKSCSMPDTACRVQDISIGSPARDCPIFYRAKTARI